MPFFEQKKSHFAQSLCAWYGQTGINSGSNQNELFGEERHLRERGLRDGKCNDRSVDAAVAQLFD